MTKSQFKDKKPVSDSGQLEKIFREASGGLRFEDGIRGRMSSGSNDWPELPRLPSPDMPGIKEQLDKARIDRCYRGLTIPQSELTAYNRDKKAYTGRY